MDDLTRADALTDLLATGLGIGALDSSGPGVDTSSHWLRLSGLMHRCIWGPVEDALSDGWSADTMEQEETTAVDTRLDLEERVIEVVGQARIDGGAWWWVVTADDDWTQPLDTSRPHEVLRVEALPWDAVTVESRDDEVRSPRYGEVEMATVLVQTGHLALSERVHGTRLLYVPGSRATRAQRIASGGRDLSTLLLYLAAVADMERAWSSTSQLLARLSVWWYKLGSVSGVTGDASAEILARLKLLVGSTSTRSIVPLVNEDEMGWAGPSVAGVRDLVTTAAERCTTVEGRPLTKMFGTPPSGMTSDDKSGESSNNQLLRTIREARAARVLRFTYDIVFGADPKRSIVWPELGQPSQKEDAEIRLLQAQTDDIYTLGGTVTAEEVRKRLIADQPHYTLEDDELPEMDELPVEGDPTMDAPPVGMGGAPVENVQQTALNGAQVTSMIEVVQGVGAGTLTIEGARAILRLAFNLSDSDALAVLAGAESIVVPTAAASPVAADAAPLEPAIVSPTAPTE